MQIWRFEIDPLKLDSKGELRITMPRGATLLHVETKDYQPSLWATVEPKNAKVQRRLFVFGTGHEFPLFHGTYVGTFMVKEAETLVFHVFDNGEA